MSSSLSTVSGQLRAVILATAYADLPKDSELELPLLRKPDAREVLGSSLAISARVPGAAAVAKVIGAG